MAKKFSLILGKDQRNEYFTAYYKSKASGFIIASVTLHSALHQDDFHFTQSEIDDLKSQLPTDAMRKIIDLSKVEVQDPLYYMQSKRTSKDGGRYFYALFYGDGLSDTDYYYGNTFEQLLRDNNKALKERVLRPKSYWEPYITPDRELVRYEPEEGE